MDNPHIHSDLVTRAEQLLIQLDEETISTPTVKTVAKLLAAVYVVSLEQENKLQIISIFNTVEQKLIELITLHGTSKIRNLLRALLSQFVSKAPTADSPDLEVDLELGAKLFAALHEINTKLTRMRMYAESLSTPLPEPSLTLPVSETTPTLSDVYSPSDLLRPEWREGFEKAVPPNFAEDCAQLQQVVEILLSDTSFNRAFEESKAAFLEKGLLQKLECTDEKSIENCLEELIVFLSDYVLICMVGVMPAENNSLECRSLVRNGLTELIETFDLLTIALATASELRECVFSPDIPPRESADINSGETWRVTNYKAHDAVYQMLSRCGSMLRGRKR